MSLIDQLAIDYLTLLGENHDLRGDRERADALRGLVAMLADKHGREEVEHQA